MTKAKRKQFKKKFIEPERWYTLSEIVEEHLFPWCKNIATYRRFVLADRKAHNFLKTIIIGEGKGRQTKYRIRGGNIINYLVNVEDGTYQIK